MARYTVFWTNEAAKDLQTIIDYIHADRPEAATSLLKKFKAIGNKITRQPERGRVVNELQEVGIKYYRQVTLAPYRIIYKLENKKAIIIAVADSRRNLEYFLFCRLTRL